MSNTARRAWLRSRIDALRGSPRLTPRQRAYFTQRQDRLDRHEVRKLIGEFMPDPEEADAPDFSLLDEILEVEAAHGGKFHHADPLSIDGPDAWAPLEGNPKQSRFRSAVRSGEFDLCIAAGTISSSKTFGIAMILSEISLEFPETWGLVVRATYKQLIDNTIPDFMSVIPPHRIRKFNRSSLTIVLDNDSLIQFRVSNEKNDKTFSWLKGKKLDWYFGNESDGTSLEFVSMARSRVGVEHRRRRALAPRCIPVSILDCNPNNTFMKEFHTRWLHDNVGLWRDRIYFEQFTIEDNRKYISDKKLAAWKRELTPAMYNRFVLGSWDAMSDREQLFLFEYMDACKGIIVPKPDADGYGPPKWPFFLGVDPARYGPDRCTFLVLHGPNIHRVDFFDTSSITEIIGHTITLMDTFKITPDHVSVDAVGLGAGVVDGLIERGVYVLPFLGSAAVMADTRNYSVQFTNLRAQVFWQVMQWMREGKIGGLNPDVLGWKQGMGSGRDPILLYEVMRQDLASIHYKYKPGSKDILIMDKEETKKLLSRSPDFADVLAVALFATFRDSRAINLELIY